MGSRKSRKRRTRRRRRFGAARWIRISVGVLLPLAVVAAALLVHVYVEVTSRFEGRLWNLPSRVYSDTLVLRPGVFLPPSALVERLERVGYLREDGPPSRPGSYRRRPERVEVFLRPLQVPWESLDARRRSIRFMGEEVISIRDGSGGRMSRGVIEPEPLATLYGRQQEEREIVTLEKIPGPLVDAVLAAEDSRFYFHHGVDPRAVARAALANVRRGKIVQGGSTITQQTVKNLYLGQERTWWRKIREILMAAVLDSRYPKDRILEVYLNEVYLGQRGPVAICGVQAASRFYFGRTLSELSLAEQALLAGLIRNPGGYNPFVHPDRAAARRDQVLDAMERLEWVDADEVARARAEPVRAAGATIGITRAPYVVDFVRSQLGELYPASALAERGLKIYTTVDTAVQTAAEIALKNGLARLERERPIIRRQKEERSLQGVVLVTRPGTGEVLAMVGGRDYRKSQFNRAVQATRQPGSCFKPFVYLAGFEAAIHGDGSGLLPSTVLEDEPLELVSGGKPWRPSNYDGQFRGPVTARRSLEESLNVPTVRAATRVGLPEVGRVAERCGFRRSFRPLPSLALGAQEVSPLELATAYSTLAHLGRRATPLILKEVTDLDGRPLERRRSESTTAVSPRAAYLVTDVLRGVMTRGTGRSARTLGMGGIVAGKTGTTDDTRDAWFVGYTPDVLALVWVGYDDNARTGLTGATGALPIWVDVMQRSGYAQSRVRFEEPSGMVRRVIDPESGFLAERGCPNRQIELFPEGAEPRGRCPLHRRGLFRWLRDRFRGRTI